MNDHERGCQGREYTCTCGYDDERDAEIDRLRALVASPKREETAVAWVKPGLINLLKIGTGGAYGAQVSNVEFSGFTVPLYATPPIPTAEAHERIFKMIVGNRATMLTEFTERPVVTITFDTSEEAWNFMNGLGAARAALSAKETSND